jgi:hypothetical protein
MAIAALGWLGAAAGEPDAPASAYPTAYPSAATAATSAPPAPPRPKLRSLADRPPPTEPSEAPKDDEWKTAEEVELLGELPPKCSAWLVREWLQLRCDHNGVAVSVVSGEKEGVDARLVPLAFKRVPWEAVTGSTSVTLPLRRGDRRLLQVTTNSYEDYNGGVWPSMLMLLSVDWLDDHEGPWVAVSREP